MGERGSSSTWAEVTGMIHHKTDPSPFQDGPVLAKLKENATEFVQMDMEAQSRVWMLFQNSLYGKVFGKPPPFEQVTMQMMTK